LLSLTVHAASVASLGDLLAVAPAGASNETVCWKGSAGRGVGKPIHDCRPPLTESGALCYPMCHADSPLFVGRGPVCWQRCRDGFVDEGALCRRKGSIVTYAKKSYGRGAGSPLTCSVAEQEDAGLCYPHCPPALPDGVGPVCWGACNGSRPVDGGAICCANGDVCSDKIRSMVAGVPLAVAQAILGGHDPASLLKDIKDAVDAVLGFVMPICSGP